MPKKISLVEASQFGIATNHEIMENGERRFRLVSSDGSSYCRTEASKHGGWQNSHFHKQATEFYAVQVGWIIYAEMNAAMKLELHYIGIGESFIVHPFVHHNLYLPSDSIIHTVKYGGFNGKDWYSSSNLDKLTKHLSEEEMKMKLHK